MPASSETIPPIRTKILIHKEIIPAFLVFPALSPAFLRLLLLLLLLQQQVPCDNSLKVLNNQYRGEDGRLGIKGKKHFDNFVKF